MEYSGQYGPIMLFFFPVSWHVNDIGPDHLENRKKKRENP